MKKQVMILGLALLVFSSCKKNIECQCKLTTDTIIVDSHGDTIKSSNYGYKWVTVKNSTRAKAKKTECANTSATSSLHNSDNTVTTIDETKECYFN